MAPSQEAKLTFGEELVQEVYQWCQEQEREYHEQLRGLVAVTVTRQSIRDCPLNYQLAEYIQNSKIKQAVALKVTHRTQVVKPKDWAAAFVSNYATQEIMDGIRERDGYYQSAVMLVLRSQKPLMPVCAMVVAIIPTTFGLYLLRYTCSTQLDQTQKEYWNPATFSMRTLHAIPFTDEEREQTLEELEDLYPQLVSFFAESSAARKTHLQSIGISGQSLL